MASGTVVEVLAVIQEFSIWIQISLFVGTVRLE